jgi:hypothetical protein
VVQKRDQLRKDGGEDLGPGGHRQDRHADEPLPAAEIEQAVALAVGGVGAGVVNVQAELAGVGVVDRGDAVPAGVEASVLGPAPGLDAAW